jgi:hypothetical protein
MVPETLFAQNTAWFLVIPPGEDKVVLARYAPGLDAAKISLNLEHIKKVFVADSMSSRHFCSWLKSSLSLMVRDLSLSKWVTQAKGLCRLSSTG